MTHHGERPDNLAQRNFKCGKVGALFRIAEEAVKHLLDLSQVGLNFSGNLGDQQFFLGLARHLVELRHFRAGHGRVFGDTAMNPLDHDVNLMSEISAKTLEVFLCVLGEQDRCRNFHGQRIGVACRFFCQPAGCRRDSLGEATIIRLAKQFDRVRQGGGIFLEQW